MGLTNFTNIVINNGGDNIMCCGPIKWGEGDSTANEIQILEITLTYKGNVIARSKGQSGLYKKNMPNGVWSLEAHPVGNWREAIGENIIARGQFAQDGDPPVVEWTDEVLLGGCPNPPAAAA